jgi:acetyl-CoA carboxylase biotin carboxyl carrier protein
MKLNEIQDLIKFVAKSGVNEVELETKDVKIRITASSGKSGRSDAPMMMQPMMQPVQSPVMQQVTTASATEVKAPSAAPVASDANYITIKSPMIGTFYRSAGPGKPLFVNVGDEIKPGKVTCIIEAMKLFNEIESEISGRIVKVLVDDATPVEYDQPLFLVEPA